MLPAAGGGCSAGAAARPARRALPHFLSCERAWVRPDGWGRAGQLRPRGRREQAPDGPSCLPSPLLGTALPPEPPRAVNLGVKRTRRLIWLSLRRCPSQPWAQTPPSPPSPPSGGCSQARQGPLLGRRGVGSRFFSF